MPASVIAFIVTLVVAVVVATGVDRELALALGMASVVTRDERGDGGAHATGTAMTPATIASGNHVLDRARVIARRYRIFAPRK